MNPSDPITEHFRIKPYQIQALKKLGIVTLHDLLYHFPARYEEPGVEKNINEVAAGDRVTLYGTIRNLKTGKTFRGNMPVAKAVLDDGTKTIRLTWFNQPYLAKMIAEGSLVRIVGKVNPKDASSMANPEIDVVDHIPHEHGASLFAGEKNEHHMPVYPESRGVTSRWILYAVHKLLAHGIAEKLIDPLPLPVLKKYNLPTLNTALIWIHAPKQNNDSVAARKRFAFEEVFLIQLGKQRDRENINRLSSFVIPSKASETKAFTERFPFTPTAAQKQAIATILNDFSIPQPMSRLLEGDVGSGKTFVAAVTAHAVVTTTPNKKDFGNLQAAYMVPTEILAKQQFESFISYFNHLPISIGLLTSHGCKKFPSKVSSTEATDISKAQLLAWVKNGEIPILVGTHALIQKNVKFKNLAYVIVDEQHRFGTAQRASLARKNDTAVHLLSMTATPIPRTLALTIYGDLDLTLLDEMPHGRKPVITKIVTKDTRESAYTAIRRELKAGRQAYVICPRINEPDPTKEMALIAKSVTEEATRLKKSVFPEYEIAVLHSKMKPSEREDVMQKFTNNKINILVATSVVEVGVNVPNATVIMIEGAERFGLAQLHQLRGRVIRSNDQAYCYVLAETSGATSRARLKALVIAKNGFELAEHDLRIRGAGELYGKRQWGISDVGMEALKNLKMVEAARTEAAAFVKTDPNEKKYPLLWKTAKERTAELHFE